jgi:hypothetical protein
MEKQRPAKGMTILFYLIGLCMCAAQAQPIRGIIRDKESGEQIAFANIAFIRLNGELAGGTASDIEGRFSWQPKQPIADVSSVRISAVGYQTKVITLNVEKFLYYEFELTKSVKELSEVVFYAGENPAHYIIRQAVESKHRHDPEKLPAYAHKTYNKFIITISGTIAAEHAIGESQLNHSNYQTDSLQTDTVATQTVPELTAFNKKHLFVSEAISERKFRFPAKLKETVIASRVSGFQNPFFSLLASNLQPFGFYRDFFTLLDKDYISPLTRNSTHRYQFILEDSTLIGRDTIYLISFEPVKGAMFEGLKGVLGINKSDYAIQQIIAETYDTTAMVMLRFRQLYKKTESGQWFPTQLNSLIKFKGQTFGKNNYLIGIGSSYISDIKIGNDAVPVQEFNHLTLETLPDAGKKDSLYWAKQRPFNLSAMEERTFQFMDSALRKTGIETFTNIAMALSTDAFSIGKLNLIPSRILRVQRFEGVRLGLGMETGTLLSRWVSLGAYAGWGTKDHSLKYGSWLRFNINRNRDFYASLMYRQDLAEAGQTSYGSPWQRQALSTNNIRNVIGITMDSLQEVRLDIGLRPTRRNLITTFSLATQQIKPTYDYHLITTGVSGENKEQTTFRFTEVSANLLFFARENNVQLMGRTIFSRHAFPVIKMRFTQGLNIWGGEFDYHKIDLSIEQMFRLRGLGRTQVRLDAGFVSGHVPLMKMYFMAGGEALNSRFIYINQAFQTVGINEFAANRYASFFFEHHFGAIYRGWRYARPSPTIVHNMAWGAMNQADSHAGISFQVPERGLFESGLIINHLIRVVYSKTLWLGLGVGVFQRYGPYMIAEPEKNRTFRVLLKFDF